MTQEYHRGKYRRQDGKCHGIYAMTNSSEEGKPSYEVKVKIQFKSHLKPQVECKLEPEKRSKRRANVK
tara:strand:+ start:160 stop:363 length:204 start_codon:yes stop_codon:yes gene_type:complete